MFGLIISGRPVDASPQPITPTQFAFRIVPAPTFSHIVVFLLPGTQLPPSTAASVHIQFPSSPEFRLLGGIGSGKESAIFKVDGLRSSATSSSTTVDGDGDVMTDGVGFSGPGTGMQGAAGGEIVVGIAVEPAAQVEAQIMELKSKQQTQGSGGAGGGAMVVAGGSGLTTKLLAQRIIGNAFNFLASFGSDTVPLKAFQDWWAKFEKKVELDPSFLERAE